MDKYRGKLHGCWMGKNIGGTLGAPFEWKRQLNDVSFYTQNLNGEPLPNDDLDIQLLWLIVVERHGLDVDAHLLAHYWLYYVSPHWAEYGTAKVNMRSGLAPPLCGTINNPYKDSCGSFIRSEIWACLFPGNPVKAALCAFQDAVVDHGDGEGVYAEVFTAVLESTAFVCQSTAELLRIGLSFIPQNSGVAEAVNDTIGAWKEGKDWQETRDLVLEKHRGQASKHGISIEDKNKGFDSGPLGYDAPSNVAIVVLGLLYGEGDFGKSITTAVNCGEDTDCTAATLGALLGIMNGIEGIPEKWQESIGRGINTISLNLGDLVEGMESLVPVTIDELSDRIEKLHHAVPHNFQDALSRGEKFLSTYKKMKGSEFRFPFFSVFIDYDGSPYIQEGKEKQLDIYFHNGERFQKNIMLQCRFPEGWNVQPAGDFSLYLQAPWFGPAEKKCTLRITPRGVYKALYRGTIRILTEGSPEVHYVPLFFLNGSRID